MSSFRSLVATHNIPEGSELFISYGIDFWRHNFKGEYDIALKNTLIKLGLNPTDPLLKKERYLFNLKI
jgi:hypothetical protein